MISWQDHQRTSSLAQRLNCDLFIVKHKGNRWLRYPYSLIATLRYLLKTRPKVVIATNPSVVLTLFMILMKPILRFTLFIDAHNEGVEPYIRRGRFIRWLTAKFHQHADHTIVTNRALADIIEKNHGRSVILPDPLPTFDNIDGTRGDYLVCICTYAPDEPVETVIEAISKQSIKLVLTGKAPQDLLTKYKGSDIIEFCGFLDFDDYLNLLRNSAGVIDISKMPSCLVCGAYEAIALERPVLVANDPVYRQTFLCRTVIPTELARISESARELLNTDMSLACKNEKEYYNVKWDQKFGAFCELLG
jgi:glycosyltransferase involved in cell wall biosynthesis